MASVWLATAVGVAAATRLELDERRFNAKWSSLKFKGPFGETHANCPITLEGSFHSNTIAKTVGALIGHISRATSGTCIEGSTTILQESLPWHITYAGFSGTLPDITLIMINLVGASFQVPLCLSTTTTARPARGNIELIRERGGLLKATNLVADPTFTIPCGIATGRFEGTATTEKLAGGQILVRLI